MIGWVWRCGNQNTCSLATCLTCKTIGMVAIDEWERYDCSYVSKQCGRLRCIYILEQPADLPFLYHPQSVTSMFKKAKEKRKVFKSYLMMLFTGQPGWREQIRRIQELMTFVSVSLHKVCKHSNMCWCSPDAAATKRKKWDCEIIRHQSIS
jgi:hypothetical protein